MLGWRPWWPFLDQMHLERHELKGRYPSLRSGDLDQAQEIWEALQEALEGEAR